MGEIERERDRKDEVYLEHACKTPEYSHAWDITGLVGWECVQYLLIRLRGGVEGGLGSMPDV